MNDPQTVFVRRHRGPSGYHDEVFHDDDTVCAGSASGVSGELPGLMCEPVGTGQLSAVCQQTERNPSAHDGPECTKCLVRSGMDGFHRSLKVETRVRTPLGVHSKPQVAARFVSLTWGFLVSGDHLVVSGSCHSVQPMKGRGPEIVPNCA